jgi:hypothetical protein
MSNKNKKIHLSLLKMDGAPTSSVLPICYREGREERKKERERERERQENISVDGAGMEIQDVENVSDMWRGVAWHRRE